MGCPRLRCGLSRLSSAVFWLSLLGIVGSMILLGWALRLKMRVGDHVDLALPGGEGYLWPGTAGLVVVLVAPVHVLGLMLVRTGVGKDFEAVRRNLSGRCGENSKSSLDRLLFLHTLLSCLSSLLVFGACAGSGYFWSLSRRRVRSGLHRAIRRYPDEPVIKTRVDRLQIELGCCGADSYVDWFFLNWKQPLYEGDNDDDDDGQYNTKLDYFAGEPRETVSADVPYSCCSPEVQRACVHQSIAGANHEPETDDQLTISSDGCQNKLLERADRAGRRLLVCLLVMSAYQLSLSILSRLLQTAKLSQSTNLRGESSDAWIFSKGPKSTGRREEELVPLKGDSTGSESTTTPKTSSSSESLYAASSSPEEKRAATSPRMQMDSRRPVEPRRNSSSDADEETPLERNFNASDFYGRFRGTLQDTLERRRQRQDWQFVDDPRDSFALPGKRATAFKSSSSGSSTQRDERTCPVHRRIQPSCCPVHGDANR